MVPRGRGQGPVEGAPSAEGKMPFPVRGHTTRSGLPGVPGVPENGLQVIVREIGACDWRESERRHRHGFGGSHATGKESATVSRRLGYDGYTQNR